MRNWLTPTALIVMLFALSAGLPALAPWLEQWQNNAQPLVYQRESFLALLHNHVLLVLLSAAAGTLVAVSAGIFVTRRSGRDFLPLVSQVASIGQTVPPVAVLALAVPVLGFGEKPIILALVLYGLLPVLRNTISGLEGVDARVRNAGRGMGMSASQILLKVDLPLALPVIVAGIRTSVTINIGTAAIGSTVGARTLGDPVIAGLVNGNTAYILQGAILMGLLALATDSVFEAFENRRARSGGATRAG